jgi:hypothetical protein
MLTRRISNSAMGWSVPRAKRPTLQRYLGALKRVRAPILAQQALNIALTDEIPAHSDSIRMRLIFGARPARTRPWPCGAS